MNTILELPTPLEDARTGPRSPYDILAAGLADLDARALRRRRRVADTPCAPRIRIDGRDLVAFASNDYLGLANHPVLVEALAEGARRYGAGSGGSHLLGGHSRAHELLESQLAEYVGGFAADPRALSFSTGYMANIAILTALAGRGATLYSDSLNHASLIDGARLARANVRIYPHADMAALAAMLDEDTADGDRRDRHRHDGGDGNRGQAGDARGNGHNDSNDNNSSNRNSNSNSDNGNGNGNGNGNSGNNVKIIVTDAVFSMDGDIAPLAELVALAERHQAWLVVDDAHGFGVHGEDGSGTIGALGLKSPLLVYMGTLGKAAGVAGAFVVAESPVIEWILQRARTYIFTTAAAPALAHAASVSIGLIRGEEGHARRACLRERIDAIQVALDLTVWGSCASSTAIQPVMVGQNEAALALADTLLQGGFWVPAVRPPTVPPGTARLRLSLSAAHELDDVRRLSDALLATGLAR